MRRLAGGRCGVAGILALLAMIGSPVHAQENEIAAEVEKGPLKGTLHMPASGEAKATVVIIPGSGPTNRDGNSPLGISAAPYKMLAEALGGQSVASVRVDKRGMFGSEGQFGDANAVTMADYSADALAWVRTAARAAGTDCAWIAGHSEGGLVALIAARDDDPALCGVVLLAAPGRRLADVLRDQLWSNPANWGVLPDALAAITKLEKGEHVDVSSFHPALQRLFAPAIQDFLIDLMSYDPAELIAQIDKPVLILQGDNDIQIKEIDAQRLAEAQPAAKLLILPGVNHVLKAVPKGDIAANFASYSDPNLPLAAGLAEAVAAFVTEKR